MLRVDPETFFLYGRVLVPFICLAWFFNVCSFVWEAVLLNGANSAEVINIIFEPP